jgi:hypothetical protein
MKKLLFLLCAGSIRLSTLACPACEKQQPGLLRGLAHGAGPGSTWEYLLLTLALLIFLFTLLYSIKWLIRPGEAATNHIKYFILNDE